MTKELQNNPPLACVILAAGQGVRMRSALPKVLHQVAGVPMISHVVSACAALSPETMVVVTAPDMKAVQDAVAPARCAIQSKPQGTADAVKSAKNELYGFKGDVMVLFGDTPLVMPESLNRIRKRRRETGASIVVSGFVPADAGRYGRLVTDDNGSLLRIVEAKDASPEQLDIELCNGGIMLFDAEKMWKLLDEVKSDNAAGEFYLTDCVALANAKKWGCAVEEMSEEELMGINTRVDLALAESVMQDKLRARAMLSGVTLTDPAATYLSADTKFGRDVTIGPGVVVGPGVEIAERVTIRAFCHLEGVKIEAGAIIGPFARVRAGSEIGKSAHIGNFVEIKNTAVGEGAKINHLSYIGDASVGARANVGAGTITCNYDGFRKSHTEIGESAFIGSNTALVAPVSIGDGAYVGAGSVITMDVPPNTLAVARGRQANIEDWAARYRDEQASRKKDG